MVDFQWRAGGAAPWQSNTSAAACAAQIDGSHAVLRVVRDGYADWRCEGDLTVSGTRLAGTMPCQLEPGSQVARCVAPSGPASVDLVLEGEGEGAILVARATVPHASDCSNTGNQSNFHGRWTR